MPTTSSSRHDQARLFPPASPYDPAAPPPACADAPEDVPRPIGKARLRALREAIRRGTYPSEADVARGLARMFASTDRACRPG